MTIEILTNHNDYYCVKINNIKTLKQEAEKLLNDIFSEDKFWENEPYETPKIVEIIIEIELIYSPIRKEGFCPITPTPTSTTKIKLNHSKIYDDKDFNDTVKNEIINKINCFEDYNGATYMINDSGFYRAGVIEF